MNCLLGEGPVWSARDDAVYWVDILAPAIHRLSLADDSITTWPMPEKTGWLIERRDQPGFIAGLQSGFFALTLDPFNLSLIADPESHLPNNRLNDAKVDSQGRIWAGSMDCDIQVASGSLYRLNCDLSIEQMDSGYRVANGPAFSTCGARMYHADTPRRVIYRFDLDAAGNIVAKSVFICFTQDDGYPDGMAIDADNHLWVAHWGGAALSRFTPAGELARRIRMPVSNITSCAFAGHALERLFVTSAADSCSGEPHAGNLFEVDPCGVRGYPQQTFAG